MCSVDIGDIIVLKDMSGLCELNYEGIKQNYKIDNYDKFEVIDVGRYPIRKMAGFPNEIFTLDVMLRLCGTNRTFFSKQKYAEITSKPKCIRVCRCRCRCCNESEIMFV